MEGYTEVFAWGGDHFGQLGLGGKTTGKTYASPRFCSFNITIKELSCGEEHSAFISSSGHIYTMGSNADGRLGIGTRSVRQSASPCLVEELVNSNASKISCGWGHTAVITDLGEVFAWGIGEFGSLGNGSIENKWIPTLMAVKGTALDVSCGSRHTGMIVREKTGKKQLMMCGGGEAGQLGTGRREKELVPVLVDFNEEIEQVSCGVFHSAVVTVRGNLYTMGGNSFGQLGLGNKKSQSRPEKVTHLENVFVKKVRCSNFTAAISDKGFLYIWGSGVFGEYLLPHRWSIREPINDLAVGSGFGIAIDNSNSVYVWGGNSNGELGLDDYDPRTSPTIIQALKGKNLKKVACGGNFCIGLGNDVFPRGKTPERFKKAQIETKKPEEVIEIPKPRIDEVEKLSYEVKQTYKSYEDIKRNFESLSEKYDIDKRSHQKYVEELNREIVRYKQEMERCRNQLELDDREIREMSICIDDLKRVNLEVTSEANSYKEELLRYKKNLEETKQVSRLEIRKVEDIREMEIEQLHEMINEEGLKRKHIEVELEKANQMIYNYEDTIRNCQMEINEISRELQQSSQKSEGEKKKMQSQIEKQQKELAEFNKKNEYLGVEKEKIQILLKSEVDKYFKENKELKFQIEMVKDQASQKSQEASDNLRQLNLLSTEKVSNEASFRMELEKSSKENLELKRKIDSALSKLQELDTLKIELSRCRNENSDYLNKIEQLYLENEQFSQKLQEASSELLKMDKMENEMERLSRENMQLANEIDYLTTDKERVSASLSAEIEHLSGQNGEIKQKFDFLYVEKEKKIHALSLDADKNVKENSDLKKKIDNLALENERCNVMINGLNEDIKGLRYQYDCVLIENQKYKSIIQDTSMENSEIKTKMQHTTQDKDSAIFKLKSELDNLNKENFELKRMIDILKQDKNSMVNSLTNEINQKNAEIGGKNNEISRMSSEINCKSLELNKISSDLNNRNSEIAKISSELSAKVLEVNRLASELSSRNSEISKLSSEIQNRSSEVSRISTENTSKSSEISKLFADNSSKSAEITALLSENNSKDKELSVLNRVIAEKDLEVQRYQEQNRLISSENQQNLEEMRFDLEKLHIKLNDHEFLYRNTKEAALDWESRYNQVYEENSQLRIEVNDLECKNRQLFDNLEKELAQRAKEYKERTISMLTNPIRSSSPHLRPPTPIDPNERVRNTSYARSQTPMDTFDKNRTDEFQGNAAAKLLQTLEDSPKSRYSSKTTMRTPTKEDIKAKIATLMQNRNRLENDLKMLDE